MYGYSNKIGNHGTGTAPLCFSHPGRSRLRVPHGDCPLRAHREVTIGPDRCKNFEFGGNAFQGFKRDDYTNFRDSEFEPELG